MAVTKTTISTPLETIDMPAYVSDDTAFAPTPIYQRRAAKSKGKGALFGGMTLAVLVVGAGVMFATNKTTTQTTTSTTAPTMPIASAPLAPSIDTTTAPIEATPAAAPQQSAAASPRATANRPAGRSTTAASIPSATNQGVNASAVARDPMPVPTPAPAAFEPAAAPAPMPAPVEVAPVPAADAAAQ
jgi:hypothetical protein